MNTLKENTNKILSPKINASAAFPKLFSHFLKYFKILVYWHIMTVHSKIQLWVQILWVSKHDEKPFPFCLLCVQVERPDFLGATCLGKNTLPKHLQLLQRLPFADYLTSFPQPVSSEH